MGWLGRLFGTEKAIDNIVDKDKGLLVRAGGWVNDLSFTEAEKAAHSLKVKEWGLKQLEALEPFKVVQRVLACTVAFMWTFMGLNIIGAIWIGNVEVLSRLVEFVSSPFIVYPTSGVFCLYVGGGTIESWKRKDK